MDFEISSEHQQLADSVGRLLNDHYSFEARAKRIATESGVDDAVWTQLAELGVFSLPLSEQSGGFGAGAVALMQPMALIGSALAVEPINGHLTACVLLDRLAAATADAGSLHELLTRCVAGEQRLAWAHVDASTDTGQHDPVRAFGGSLEGSKVDVEGADRADWLLVTVTGGADPQKEPPSVYLVPRTAPGLTIRTARLLDNRNISDVQLRKVPLTGQVQRLGEPSEAVRQAIKEALDFSACLVCAEAVGVIEFTCATTLDYLKTRKQFGVPIGSFQALQHRIVDLYVELEQVRSMAALACSKFDASRGGQVSVTERGRAVAAARVYLARAARKVAQESIQLHGGMGMAEELKVSHAFRRLTVMSRQGGHEATFLDRFIHLGRQDAAAGNSPAQTPARGSVPA